MSRIVNITFIIEFSNFRTPRKPNAFDSQVFGILIKLFRSAYTKRWHPMFIYANPNRTPISNARVCVGCIVVRAKYNKYKYIVRIARRGKVCSTHDSLCGSGSGSRRRGVKLRTGS